MIYDTQEEVERKTKRDLAALEERRRKGMALLKKGLSQAEVARAVGVSRMTVMRWERLRTVKAKGAWKRRKLGRPSKRGRRQQQRHVSDLNRCDQSNEFIVNLSSLQQLAQVLEREHQVNVQPLHLWQTLMDMGEKQSGQLFGQSQCL
jgi:transposase